MPDQSAASSGMRLPPGSLGIPWLGETLALAADPHRFYLERARRHGELFKTRIVGHNTAVFSGPRALSFMFAQKTLSRQGGNPTAVEGLLHDSLPLLDGREHALRKSLVLQAFRPSALTRYLPVVERMLGARIERWHGLGEFHWLAELDELGAALAAALVLGDERAEVAAQVHRCTMRINAGFSVPPVNLPFTKYGRAMTARRALLKLAGEAVVRRRAAPGADILSELLAARDAHGRTFPPDALAAEVVHLVFAAQTGFMAALTLFGMAMAEQPDLRDRLREEILAGAPAGALTLAELDALPLLGRTVCELRRYYPLNPATFFATVTEPLEYGGYHIPAGWRAVGALRATMHDPGTFTEPARFDTERFRPECTRSMPANAWVPHGGGEPEGHRCAGEPLVTLLLQVAGGVAAARVYLGSRHARRRPGPAAFPHAVR
jgi:retinoid hydroxylase